MTPGPAVPRTEASKASGAKESRKKQAAPPVRDPPIPSLNALPGSGSGLSPPSGEDNQGPSPVDYTLEIEAVFPQDMVQDLKKCEAQRARKTVIRRTLGGRASHKDLVDCLKLHLPAPFVTVTLLTRGYFEILFEDEEGAKATRKLAAVEWSGWALSFSKYSENFRPNELGAEKLLTHSIKVQFPDLNVQFRTIKALTIMASSIGEVLDIESPDSYIKRPTGPMVTVEAKEKQLPNESYTQGYRISAENAVALGTWPERVCKTNLHHREESSQRSPPPLKGSWKTAPRKTPDAQRWRQTTTANTAKEQLDYEMKDSSEPSTQPEDSAKHAQELRAEGRQKLNALRNSAPIFGIQEMASAQAPSPATKSNPFAILGEGSAGAATLMEEQEVMKDGWSFQGRKRHEPKQTPPRQATQQPSSHLPHKESTPGGGKKGQLHSEVHPSYFTSLNIQVPPIKEPLRARVWPVLTRTKEGKKETLVHCKNQSQPNLPLYLRISGPTEAAETEWTQESARADLIQRLELELEENILRFKWCIKE
ncbi:unnamed protein product [Sphagnum jensenii]|uniref:Uncharacterized protein n=1 Tax=Sphagnum jensenii TaxID=128206 RepID=A0ABP0WKX3_9BRYO